MTFVSVESADKCSKSTTLQRYLRLWRCGSLPFSFWTGVAALRRCGVAALRRCDVAALRRCDVAALYGGGVVERRRVVGRRCGVVVMLL